MHLEITTSHHPIVLGKNSQHLREIMQRTNTIIIFQDSNDTNVKPIKRSQVTISGPINGVYLARQQLLVSNFYKLIQLKLILFLFRVIFPSQ